MVEGYFYVNNEKICRKILTLKTIDSIVESDLLVIMMNPGSSHPVGTSDYLNIPLNMLEKQVVTIPDETQSRIFGFMYRNGFNNAIVINITDVCNPKSSKLKSEDKDYSNFQNKEKAINFIKAYLPKSKRVLIAWGCKSVFKELIINAKQALSSLGVNKVYGFPSKKDKDLYFYHPLVRGLKWEQGVEVIDIL